MYTDMNDLSRYTGDFSQVFYAKEYRLHGGHADGMRAIDIANGGGLELTLLPDRAMDIGRFAYNAVNCAHIGNVGYIRPEYFDRYYNGPFRTFAAGFLTTCGLKNVGPGSIDGDHVYPAHGGIGNEPAEEVCVRIDTESSAPCIHISGRIRQAVFMGNALWLHRTYTIPLFGNRVRIRDQVENRGFLPEEIMILYHFNMGFPLLDGQSVFMTGNEFERSRDTDTLEEIEKRYEFQEPENEYAEKVFYYRQKSVAEGKGFAALLNPALDIMTVIWTLPDQLPWLTNWKNPRSGAYAMGIEPANCKVEGIAKQREYGVEALPGRAIKEVDLEIELASGTRIEELRQLSSR